MQYEKLDKYVSERETALEAARGEVKELKIEINKLALSNGQLENDLFEYKAQVTRLEKQKETLTKKTSDHGNNESHNKLKESFDQMNQKYEEKKKEISTHQVSLTIFYKRGLLFSIVSCCFLLLSYHFKLSSLEIRICEMIPGVEYETLTLGPLLLMMMIIVIINITFIF